MVPGVSRGGAGIARKQEDLWDYERTKQLVPLQRQTNCQYSQ